jgi:hypothetical protein
MNLESRVLKKRITPAILRIYHNYTPSKYIGTYPYFIKKTRSDSEAVLEQLKAVGSPKLQKYIGTVQGVLGDLEESFDSIGKNSSNSTVTIVDRHYEALLLLPKLYQQGWNQTVPDKKTRESMNHMLTLMGDTIQKANIEFGTHRWLSKAAYNIKNAFKD